MQFTTLQLRHKKALNNILQDENLYNVTSERQEKNGTIAILDLTTQVTYTLHTSGYVRHNDNNGLSWWGDDNKRSWQLNRVSATGEGWRKTYRRVLATFDEQIIIMVNAIHRDRAAQAIQNLREEIIDMQKELRKL